MGKDQQQDEICNSIASFVNKWEADKKAGKTPHAYGYLKAKIVKIGEKDITAKTGQEYHIHEYTVKDGTKADTGQDDIILGVFMEKDAEEPFDVGEIIDGTDINAKSEFKGKLQLSTTKKTKLTKAKPGTTISSGGGSGKASGSTGKASGGTGTGSTTLQSDIAELIDAAADKIVVAIHEMQVAFIEQLKESIKAVAGPDSSNEQDETGASDDEGSADDQHT
jgi:hypothetical protein